MKKQLLFLICLISVPLIAQQINEPFLYPIRPGTKEWSELRTEEERFQALQIPDDLLSKMSTQALVVSCLNLPAFGYYTAYDIMLDGMVILTSNFNGIRELVRRKDSGLLLMDVYRNASTEGFESENLLLEEEFWPLKLTYLELLLSSKRIIQLLNKEEKEELLLIARKKYELKTTYKDGSQFEVLPTVFLMARVIHSLNYSPFESEYAINEGLRNLITSSMLFDSEIVIKVINLTDMYLKSANEADLN